MWIDFYLTFMEVPDGKFPQNLYRHPLRFFKEVHYKEWTNSVQMPHMTCIKRLCPRLWLSLRLRVKENVTGRIFSCSKEIMRYVSVCLVLNGIGSTGHVVRIFDTMLIRQVMPKINTIFSHAQNKYAWTLVKCVFQLKWWECFTSAVSNTVSFLGGTPVFSCKDWYTLPLVEANLLLTDSAGVNLGFNVIVIGLY